MPQYAQCGCRHARQARGFQASKLVCRRACGRTRTVVAIHTGVWASRASIARPRNDDTVVVVSGKTIRTVKVGYIVLERVLDGGLNLQDVIATARIVEIVEFILDAIVEESVDVKTGLICHPAAGAVEVLVAKLCQVGRHVAGIPRVHGVIVKFVLV
jgi:hypothetical protein